MYRIKWTKRALNQLAEIWLDAKDRNAVTVASATVEAHLKRGPLDFGESRQSSVNRLAFSHPIYIEYDVVEDDKKVIVLRVGLTG